MNKYLKTYISHRNKNEYFINDIKPFETFIFPKLNEQPDGNLIYPLARYPEMIPHFLKRLLLVKYGFIKKLHQVFYNSIYYITNSDKELKRKQLQKIKEIYDIKKEIEDCKKNPNKLSEMITKYGKEIVLSTFDLNALTRTHHDWKFTYTLYTFFPEILHDESLDSTEISVLSKNIINSNPDKINDLKHFLTDKDKIGVTIQNPSLSKILDVDLNKIIKTINNSQWIIEHLVFKSNDYLKQVKENPELKQEIERVFDINLEKLPNDILDLSLYEINNDNHIKLLLSLPNSFNDRKVVFGNTYEVLTNDNNKIKNNIIIEITDEIKRISYEVWDNKNFYYVFDFNIKTFSYDKYRDYYNFTFNKINISNKKDEILNIVDTQKIKDYYKILEYALDTEIDSQIQDIIKDNYIS